MFVDEVIFPLSLLYDLVDFSETQTITWAER